jgi:hypothetical protein
MSNYEPVNAPQAICTGCNKKPSELSEYVTAAKEMTEYEDVECTPDDYVWAEEGTMNRLNGHFLCTKCYIKAGQPSGPGNQRWVAP